MRRTASMIWCSTCILACRPSASPTCCSKWTSHSGLHYWQLSRLARWHIESEAIEQALANVVAAQEALPMARVLEMGTTASADGPFYPATRQDEAINTVNPRYGNDPDIKAYSHINDRSAPFASRTIPATVSEAPYLLDGLTMNNAGRWIEEQYADTGGFTDHLFGISAMLGLPPRAAHPRPTVQAALRVRSRRHTKRTAPAGGQEGARRADRI